MSSQSTNMQINYYFHPNYQNNSAVIQVSILPMALVLFLYEPFVHFVLSRLVFSLIFKGWEWKTSEGITSGSKEDLEIKNINQPCFSTFLQCYESQIRHRSFHGFFFFYQFRISLWGLKPWYVTQLGLIFLEQRLRFPCIFLSLLTSSIQDT